MEWNECKYDIFAVVLKGLLVALRHDGKHERVHLLVRERNLHILHTRKRPQLKEDKW
jgi:hypothetical protein